MDPQDAARMPQGSQSTLDRLRAKRQRIAEARTLDLAVPGYGDELVVRYRPVEHRELGRIGDRAEKNRSPDRVLHAHADVLASACVEVLVRDGEELEPIVPGQVTRFDADLAAALGVEGATTARAVVLGVFNNDLAVSQTANQVSEWMASADADVDDELLGNS